MVIVIIMPTAGTTAAKINDQDISVARLPAKAAARPRDGDPAVGDEAPGLFRVL
jgi:hypothetical protein